MGIRSPPCSFLTYGWKMQVVHKDKRAYTLIVQGNMDVVVADIDTVDLGRTSKYTIEGIWANVAGSSRPER